MELSNIIDKLKERFFFSPQERFYYFFWDLRHFFDGVDSGRYLGRDFKYQDWRKARLNNKISDEQILDLLEKSIKKFYKLISKKNDKKLSGPIDLNNINRYGWEWIMEDVKLNAQKEQNDNPEKQSMIIDLVKDHEDRLSGAFSGFYKSRY